MVLVVGLKIRLNFGWFRFFVVRNFLVGIILFMNMFLNIGRIFDLLGELVRYFWKGVLGCEMMKW